MRAVDARAFIRRVVSFCGSRDGQGHPRPCHWPGPPLTLSSGFYFSFFSGHTIQTLMSKAGRNATTELANLLYLLSTLVLIAEADCGNTWPHRQHSHTSCVSHACCPCPTQLHTLDFSSPISFFNSSKTWRYSKLDYEYT